MNNINKTALDTFKKPFKEAQTAKSIKPLKHLFADNQYFKIEPLDIETIFPVNKVNGDIQKCFDKLNDMDKYDIFAADYLLCKHLSFVSYKDVSLYELCKKEAVFASVEYALQTAGKNTNNIDAKNLLMIEGNFFGIQRFIFEATPTNKAAKTLRAKSAYIQLLTRAAAFYIVEKLGLGYLNIVSTNAGKFEILGINTEETKKIISDIQKELNKFFIQNFFGETGIGISVAPCSFSDFEKDKYREFRTHVEHKVEESKFKKFDLLETNPILDYDDGIDNETLCPYCAKRKKKDNAQACETCDKFIQIGEQLTKDGFLAITKNKNDILIFGDYHAAFAQDADDFKDAVVIYDMKGGDFRGYAKWEIASYVKKDKNGAVMDFDKLAELSCSEEESGIKALIGLKGDVDEMGKFIKTSNVTADFMSFNFFSRMVDYFFSVYTPNLMREKYKNLYTVFAGGDDLFVFGAWNEVIEFSKELREKFMQFADNKLSFSVGMALGKANKPVNFIARVAEEELERSKAIDKKKDAIALFGECVKWDEYIKIGNELMPFLKEFEAKINTAFLYNVLELVEMRKMKKQLEGKDKVCNKPKEIDRPALWKSKLNYTFKRNIYNDINDEEKPLADKLFDKLYEVIENNPKETRMVLSEYIYKRRKQQ